MTTRPNFLLFITDQHRADHLGCYGNPIVQTPNIDSIAARGTRFENFYVACPICMPNRATLMTGRMPSLHGVRHNGIPLSLQAVTFTHLMQAADYRTALIGKGHLQSISPGPLKAGLPEPDPAKASIPQELAEARRGQWKDGDYEQELRTRWRNSAEFDLSLPFYGFDHVSLVVGHGDRVTGHYERWLANRHPDPDSLRGPDNALPINREIDCPQAWRTRLPEDLYPTSYVAEETIAFLKAHAASDRSQPFFLQCSFPDPHHPFTPPGRYFDMYDPADVPVPDAFFHPPDKRPPHLKAIHDERDAGKANKGGQRAFGCTETEARGAIALNYGSITMIDDAIGRVLRSLKETGLIENTVVVFTTDHGDFMGDHQLLLKGALHYQGVIRVPCIWADPSETEAPSVSNVLAGTIDLPASFLERAGINPFNGMQGHSLPLLSKGETVRDGMLVEEHQRRGYMGFAPNFRARTLLADGWRLTVYSGADWGELYDLRTDPLEFENRWEDPVAAGQKAEMMERLVRQMMALSESSPIATGHGP